MATININDNASPELRAQMARMAPKRMASNAAKSGANHLRRHLVAWNAANPNKLGGKRTNWGIQAARSVTRQVTGDGAIVGATKLGLRQRFQGGKITPKRAKYLALPAAAETHGKSPREFNNLRWALVANKYGNLAPALVKRDATLIKKGQRKGKVRYSAVRQVGGETMFWLVKQVWQSADPTVMPTKEAMSAAIMADIEYDLNRPSGAAPTTGGLA